MKKNIIIVLSVVLLLAVGSAVAFAEGVLTDDQQDSLDQKADRLEALVKEGKITSDQADAYLDGFEQRLLDGTCQGDGTGCTDGEECELGLGDTGECLGLGAGFASDGSARGFGSFCGGGDCGK